MLNIGSITRLVFGFLSKMLLKGHVTLLVEVHIFSNVREHHEMSARKADTVNWANDQRKREKLGCRL